MAEEHDPRDAPPPAAPGAARPRAGRSRREWLGTTALVGGAALAGAGGAWWIKQAQRHAEPRPLPSVRRQGPRPPNVLLVTSSAERQDLPAGLDLPGHERLLMRGTQFTQWHANAVGTSPSRSVLLCGQHSQRTGMVANLGVFPGADLDPRLPTLGHYLRANGYLTACKGRWMLSESPSAPGPSVGRFPNTRDALEPWGFSDWNFDGEPRAIAWAGYRADAAIAADAARWLHTRGRTSEQPWLLCVNFVNPHDITFAAASVAQLASRRQRDYLSPLAGPPVDPVYDRRWSTEPLANGADDLARKPWAQRNFRDFLDQAFGRLGDDDEAWHAYRDHYFNCIRDVDRHLATVLDALQSSGQADRTVVIYTSDQGEMAGAHGLRQTGPFMYQEAMRLPFIVRHPDLDTTRRTEAMGCTLDLVPTVLELIGCPPKDVAEAYPQLAGVPLGTTLARAAARTDRDERGILFVHNAVHHLDTAFAVELMDHGVPADRWLPLRTLWAGMRPLPHRHLPMLMRGIHTGRHKFARYFKPAEHHRPLDWETLIRHNTLEMYDLKGDAAELENLAHAPEWNRSQVAELNVRLNDLVKREVGADLGDELPGLRMMKRL